MGIHTWYPRYLQAALLQNGKTQGLAHLLLHSHGLAALNHQRWRIWQKWQDHSSQSNFRAQPSPSKPFPKNRCWKFGAFFDMKQMHRQVQCCVLLGRLTVQLDTFQTSIDIFHLVVVIPPVQGVPIPICWWKFTH